MAGQKLTREIKASLNRAYKAISAHLPLTVGLLIVIVLLVVGYNVLQALRINASDVGAVSGAVAAVAGALAALAALAAARESSRTAKDASRALALATKPIAEMRMSFERSESNFALCTLSVDIENLSLHPIKGGTLRWLLRDGSTGSHPVGEIVGRKTPFGGMFHRAEGVETLVLATSFDDRVGGEDRVTLDYWGGVRDISWRSTLAIEWVVVPNQWSERDGVRVATTKRNRHDRTEIEL